MKLVHGLALGSVEERRKWDSLLELWERTRPTRAFVWNQKMTDEKRFLSQWLAEIRALLRADFCLAALSFRGKSLEVASPGEFGGELPSHWVAFLWDSLSKSQESIVVEDPNRESGFQSLVLTPLRPLGIGSLGLLVTASSGPRVFTLPELFVLQLLADELILSFEKVQCVNNSRILLAHVSHELRTPLTVILADCRNLGDNQGASLSQDQQRLLWRIEHNAVDILNLIHGLLDLTAINEGVAVVTLHPVELTELMEDTMVPFRRKAREKGIGIFLEFAPDLPEAFVTDALKLRQVVRNLIDNAVTFTFQGGVTVKVETQNEALRIRVEDTGIGIDEKDLTAIFEPFRQLNGTSRRGYGGLGIGLHLVKEYVKLLQGSVQVESTPGEGSVFTVFVPGPGSHPPPAFKDEQFLAEGEGKFRRIGSLQGGIMGNAIKVGLLLFAISVVTGCSTQSAKTVETEKTVQYAADKDQGRTEPTVVERQTTRTEEKTKSEGESAGLLSGTVRVVGQVLALPFRVVGGLIGVVF